MHGQILPSSSPISKLGTLYVPPLFFSSQHNTEITATSIFLKNNVSISYQLYSGIMLTELLITFY